MVEAGGVGIFMGIENAQVNLFILRYARNPKNARNAERRYAAGTRRGAGLGGGIELLEAGLFCKKKTTIPEA
jgi:hypothetical protein